MRWFQHTAARRRLDCALTANVSKNKVSTHSRPKAAGCPRQTFAYNRNRFNTQPPEGGWPPIIYDSVLAWVFQHTAARRRLVPKVAVQVNEYQFQHTAARRRLETFFPPSCNISEFQHTAARRRLGRWASCRYRSASFNTQPPEGGWVLKIALLYYCYIVSTHSRPKAAGNKAVMFAIREEVSTHSRPKAAGPVVCECE